MRRDLADAWLPQIRSRQYDSSARPLAEKAGVTIGMGMTEKQGGSDVGANHQPGRGQPRRLLADHRPQMVPVGADERRLPGARPDARRPLLLPDAALPARRHAATRIRLMRLKDKLGNRSNATAEVEFDERRRLAGRRARPRRADDHRHGDADPARLRRRLRRADAASRSPRPSTTRATARPSARCSSTSR